MSKFFLSVCQTNSFLDLTTRLMYFMASPSLPPSKPLPRLSFQGTELLCYVCIALTHENYEEIWKKKKTTTTTNNKNKTKISCSLVHITSWLLSPSFHSTSLCLGPFFVQNSPCFLGPTTLPDRLTLDFWIHGHVQQTPAQCCRGCFCASQEEVQSTADEVLFSETWSSVRLAWKITVFNGFLKFVITTAHKGFILGPVVGLEGKDPRRKDFP